MKKIAVILIIFGTTLAAAWFLYPKKKIDFSAQVKPILNKNCIICHGGVRRKAGFSLLFRQDALGPTESGKPAIIPGKPDESEFIKRLTLQDPEERMPYKHEPLSAKEIETLRQWVTEGAEWGDHWAYVPVKPVEVPTAEKKIAAWVRNDLDLFVADKWTDKKLLPSPEADKATLLRRVSLDLTGLPPTKKISRQFLQDNSVHAYENLVDALQASPHYGERWTSLWLDLARYADTKGYERDDSRNIWRYRDWLIHAFNEDKPYDQFITEQLAGDLLPNPTDQQLIATAFHRNTMTNDEGGTENEEFRTAAVLDRVNTTWEVLMGTTFACTQCHSHPYDPFRHEDYYKFMAFFNNSRDEDTYADYPLLRHFEKKDSIDVLKIKEWVAKNSSAKRSREINQFIKTWQPSVNSLLSDHFVNSELSDTKWLIFRNHAVSRLPHIDLTEKNYLIYRFSSWSTTGTWTLHADKPDGPVLMQVTHKNTKGKWTIDECPLTLISGIHDLYFTYDNPGLKKPDDNGMMFDWFYFTEPFPGKGKEGYDSARSLFRTLIDAPTTTTPIMMDNPAPMTRASFVFERGNWLVKGEEVQPETPRSLLPFPKNAPANRLGLAQWMTDRDNPLTSRTLVNRMWEQIFGTGLAETLEDLGTQGAAPTHPQLLDYLSGKLMNEYQWSVKTLVKTIVMSATYRQDSRISAEGLEKDPDNRYYARGARVRLSAEEVRDQTLAVAGLLSDVRYGPSVMPFQPKGIWQSPWNGQDWKISKGNERYRRSIYTYWKRTSPYPAMIMFDGMAREVCAARRIRTNTPLQALVTLNDSTYIEAARNLALMTRQSSNGSIREQIQKCYALALGHEISEEKLTVLMDLYNQTSTKFKHASLTDKVQGDRAFELVTSVILNLDEFITKN
jgi:Protein of unknown function (DUF1553)/Protein of unknown function (DUF1549)/Planctomycete cytochrome C